MTITEVTMNLKIELTVDAYNGELADAVEALGEGTFDSIRPAMGRVTLTRHFGKELQAAEQALEFLRRRREEAAARTA